MHRIFSAACGWEERIRLIFLTRIPRQLRQMLKNRFINVNTESVLSISSFVLEYIEETFIHDALKFKLIRYRYSIWIILNWNNQEITKKCLESLSQCREEISRNYRLGSFIWCGDLIITDIEKEFHILKIHSGWTQHKNYRILLTNEYYLLVWHTVESDRYLLTFWRHVLSLALGPKSEQESSKQNKPHMVNWYVYR
jgi:hypothetical protein